MQKSTTYLWLSIPPALVVTAWCATGGVAEAGSSEERFALLLGTLVSACVAGLFGSLVHRRFQGGHRRGGSGTRQMLRVVESFPLASGRWIHVVQFRSEMLLIGDGREGLTRLDDPRDLDSADATDYIPEGVDLKDTPRREEAPQPRARSLAETANAGRSGRTALTEANLAEFRTLLKQARSALRE